MQFLQHQDGRLVFLRQESIGNYSLTFTFSQYLPTAHANSVAEVREVLDKYLELFQQSSLDFKYHLAPNSVIDWYGRTVRGANKIHDYLR